MDLTPDSTCRMSPSALLPSSCQEDSHSDQFRSHVPSIPADALAMMGQLLQHEPVQAVLTWTGTESPHTEQDVRRQLEQLAASGPPLTPHARSSNRAGRGFRSQVLGGAEEVSHPASSPRTDSSYFSQGMSAPPPAPDLSRPRLCTPHPSFPSTPQVARITINSRKIVTAVNVPPGASDQTERSRIACSDSHSFTSSADVLAQHPCSTHLEHSLTDSPHCNPAPDGDFGSHSRTHAATQPTPLHSFYKSGNQDLISAMGTLAKESATLRESQVKLAIRLQDHSDRVELLMNEVVAGLRRSIVPSISSDMEGRLNSAVPDIHNRQTTEESGLQETSELYLSPPDEARGMMDSVLSQHLQDASSFTSRVKWAENLGPLSGRTSSPQNTNERLDSSDEDSSLFRHTGFSSRNEREGQEKGKGKMKAVQALQEEADPPGLTGPLTLDTGYHPRARREKTVLTKSIGLVENLLDQVHQAMDTQPEFRAPWTLRQPTMILPLADECIKEETKEGMVEGNDWPC